MSQDPASGGALAAPRRSPWSLCVPPGWRGLAYGPCWRRCELAGSKAANPLSPPNLGLLVTSGTGAMSSWPRMGLSHIQALLVDVR